MTPRVSAPSYSFPDGRRAATPIPTGIAQSALRGVRTSSEVTVPGGLPARRGIPDAWVRSGSQQPERDSSG
ncbi:MAG: hypothetical protein R2854_17855 [Caldilineaceae bacterium]